MAKKASKFLGGPRLEWECLKFAPNPAAETISHNANLATWWKVKDYLIAWHVQVLQRETDLCMSWKTAQKTLNCDATTTVTTQSSQRCVEFVGSHWQDNTDIISDLPDVPYQYPLHNNTTDLWPNTFIWRDNNEVNWTGSMFWDLANQRKTNVIFK